MMKRHIGGVGHNSDMTSCPIFSGLFFFAVPVMLTGVLQLLYNAADLVMVGRFSENGQNAVAAVSSTGSLVNLTVNLFLGLAVGASVSIAIALGAKDWQDASKLTHTAICMAGIGGVLIGAVGFSGAHLFLTWMGSPPTVIDSATLYLRIYFLGAPAIMLYNFGTSILRTTGDTKRPLLILATSGLLNVLLNLLFVIVFRMSVAGVALATTISQYISAVAVLICLTRCKNQGCRLSARRLRISVPQLKRILMRGVPAGIQSSIFSLSNVLLQSAVNSFGDEVMAGCGAGGNIEGFIYTIMNAYYHACMTYTGQNVGARKYHRLDRVLFHSALHAMISGILSGLIAFVLARPLILIYLPNGSPEAIAAGITRLQIISATYFTCGIMEAITGSSRGMGASLTPMLMSILGICGFRIVWTLALFPYHRTIFVLYLAYPISWVATALVQFVGNRLVRHRLERAHLASERSIS